jgi:FdhD protein
MQASHSEIQKEGVTKISVAGQAGASARTARAMILRCGPLIGAQPCSDHLAREEPLEIRVRGQSVVVTMRTPGNDIELAAGFLLGEGVIRRREDVLEIAHCRAAEPEQRGNILNVFLSNRAAAGMAAAGRQVYVSSSCGLCGKASIESVRQHFPPVDSTIEVDPAALFQMPEAFRAAQESFALTGGLHAAALFDINGRLQSLHEDVGRHNAVDKLLGHSFLAGQLPLSDSVLVVSGRVSFEIMQKALAAGIAVVAAFSAPSSLAVDFAKESNQTLVGFLRSSSMNVYSCPERIVIEEMRSGNQGIW